MCKQTFIAALFIIAQSYKQLKCPLISEWINKMWYIPMEYYSATKKKGRNTDITQTKPKNIMLSERSQMSKNTCCMIPFI